MRRGRGMGDCLLSTLLPDGSCPDMSMYTGAMDQAALNPVAVATTATTSLATTLLSAVPATTWLIGAALIVGLMMMSKGGR